MAQASPQKKSSMSTQSWNRMTFVRASPTRTP